MTLLELCRAHGLTPIITIVRARRIGRPKGSRDSYDREQMRRQRIEEYAAAMRERYGDAAEYERELWGPAGGK